MTRILRHATPLLLLALSAAAAPAEPGFDVSREDIKSFIAGVAKRDGFDREELKAVLRDAIPQTSIIDLISKPAERTMTWWEYRSRFLTEARIAAGAQLWNDQREPLERIAKERGIPPEYLVAIAGVETFYGRIMGRYRVLDALATLGFNYPQRGEYFRKELEQFLLLAREEKTDPRVALGSYAGAMGAGQFMPSSLRRYAVDGDGDGQRNLREQWPDVFASIANYFASHGWRTGEPVMAEVSSEAVIDQPEDARVELADTVASLHMRGYQFETTLPDSARAMLVPAQQEQLLTWRVGFENFYVITRYNRSPLYAMAVHDLAEAVAQREHAPVATPPAVPVP
jgi:membrane-bound lytic murein transglycosylase B